MIVFQKMSVLGQKKNVFLKLAHILYYKSVLHINFLVITLSSFSLLVSFKINPVNILHIFAGHKDTVKAFLLSVAK